jgi:PAS domain S-box-containing protein
MTCRTQTLLLLENFAQDRELYRRYLMADAEQNYCLLEAESVMAGLALCRSHSIDAILLDYALPDGNGLEFIQALQTQSNGGSPPVVMITGEGNERIAVQAIKLGAEDYLVKQDLTPELLQVTMRSAIENRLLQQQLEQTEVALKAANEQITTILASMTDAYTALDREWRFVYTNPASTQVIQRLTHQESEEFLGKTHWEILPWTVGTIVEREYRRAMAEQVAVHFELFYEPSEDWFEVHAYPSQSGLGIYFRNVSDRKQIEANLRKREEQLRLFVKHAPAGVAMFDREMCYVEVSDRWITSYGLDEQDLIGRSHYEIFPEIPDRWKAIHQRCLAGAVEMCEEDQFPRADGSIDWVRWEIRPWRTNTDEIGGIIVFSEVITDRKQAESRQEFLATVSQALMGPTSIQKMVQTIGEHLNRYLNTSRFALVEIDEAANQAYVNHTWQLPGIPSLVGVYQIQESITDELRQAIRNGEMIVFRDVTTDPRIVNPMQYTSLGIGAELNVPLVRDGEWIFSLSVFHAAPHNWQTGDLELMRELLERIWSQIERIRAETALRESEQRLQAIISHSNAAIFMKDMQGRYLLMNRECERLFKITQDWIFGKTDYDLFPQDIADALRENDRQVLASGAALTLEEKVPLEDGIHTYVAVKFPLLDQAGVPYAICGISTDISDRARLQGERDRLLIEAEAAREEAEAANRSKDEFVAVVAHELRSPLNAISGWAKLLQTRKFDEGTLSKALNTIWRNTQTQVQLIEDLLDVSRLVKGTLQINSAPVNLTSVIEAVLDNIRPMAEAKNIELQPHLTVTPMISGDFNRLQQIVVNLLNNAIKFTPSEGRVEVALEQVDAAVRLQVRDTGKGIAPEFLPYVFERFKQGQQNTGSQDGLGLGLAIVRNLVELHGGTISAESAGINQGTTFTVQLPRLEVPAIDQSRSPPPIHQNALTGIRILAVDDEPDMLSLIKFVLEDFGAEVESVAMAAIDCLSQFKPDILISDLAMPGRDGYELVQQVKSQPAGQIPAIALTSYASATYEERSLQAGFQRHLAKPVEPQVLVTTILDLIGARN